jgi:1,4-dihydroxy-2-naphthoate octaprenyltransferase
MPVFWFALSFTKNIIITDSILVFIILHLLVYPASNGYNSYMDKDTASIGGIEKPLPPTKQLFVVSVIMDMLAILTSLYISFIFSAGIVLYVLASRAYSYRGIRLKKYPVTGYLTVMIFQGALVFALVYHGAADDKTTDVPLVGMIAAALLIGGFYPLTQIYQHTQDKEDGVKSISLMLGYKGTFICSALIFTTAMLSLAAMLTEAGLWNIFIIFSLFFLPVLLYFFWWAAKVWRSHIYADFRKTMGMNLIASVCTNAAFIYLFINRH